MEQEKELLEQIVESMHRMKKARFENLFEDLSQQDFFVMQMIVSHKKKEKRGICVSEIAKKMKISAPAVSRKLGEMEEKGLITRAVDPKDRRNTYVTITQRGETIREEAGHIVDTLFIRVIRNMGEDNVRQMIQLWNQFASEMEKEVKKIEKGEAHV